ncbi:MAG: MFS transporter [Chloroflexi bacterium]|nr:MFS transporter [Chloroflexota bacterium]MBI3338766.1 MFS transporter [Chloroflexota bacterium]
MEEPISQEPPVEPVIEERSNPFAALRHRNFQLYFGGQLISNAGTWMQIIAQGWLVYQISRSDLTLGIVGFASAIPTLIISPWGGVIVDRVPKRSLLILTQASAMLLAFILAALAFTNTVREWHIILLAAGLGVVNAFDAPARQAFVIEMVGKEDLPNAIALNSMMFNSARVIGPAIAGILLVILGAAWGFMINGFSYLAVIIGLWAMQLKPHVPVRHVESPWKQLNGGLYYVSKHSDLSGLLLLALIFSVFGISYSTILPAFVEQVLKQGAIAYGWINTATGVGAVTGAFLIANHHGSSWRGSWLRLSSLAFPVILAVFAFTSFFPASLMLAFGLGVGFMLEFTLINTLLQTRVDDALRGRVMGLYTLTFFGFAPFGNLAVGALAERIGLSYAMMLFAMIGLVLSLIALRKFPQIRKLP